MEFYPYKTYYIFFMLAVFLILGYAWIGAPPAQRDMINFYMLYLAVPFLFIFFVDLFTEKKFEEIQTITIDEPHEGLEWLSPKLILMAGIVLGILVFWKIAVTGTAFVDTIRFGIFEGVWGNAVLSGLVGVVENWIFFGTLFPTTLSFTERKTGSIALAFIIALAITTATFTYYHNFRYGHSETAMLSVAFFSVINCFAVYVTQSLVISDAIHFFNNVAVSVLNIQKIALAVIL